MRRRTLPLLLIATLGGGLAVAQTKASDDAALAQAKREAAEAALRSTQLERQAAKANDEAARARAQSDALVARIEVAEAEISAAEAELRIADAAAAAQRKRLARRQRPVVELTAALQTIARRPPALALVQPGSTADLVHVRALLAAAAPAVRRQTGALRAEAEAAAEFRNERLKAVRSLAAARDDLKRRQLALARLEETEQRRSREFAQFAFAQADRALAFGEEARDVAGRMSSGAFQTEVASALAALPGPRLRPPPGEQPRAATSGNYRLPVNGRLLAGFGEISDAGIHARGLTFQAAANSPVTAPCAGQVVYAGRFRSYGEVVILDHGGGWTTTVTRLGALRVSKGDTVKAGDPLGRTGTAPVSVELRHKGVPQPITSFISSG